MLNRRHFFIAGVALLMVTFAACKSAPEAAMNEPGDLVLNKLAVLFDKQDAPGISPLIADGWSGLRFTAGWSADTWHETATELRSAKLKSSTPDERVYVLTVQGQPKEVKVLRTSETEWKLDYNSFKGPFPHL